jgi:hypothetical protein
MPHTAQSSCRRVALMPYHKESLLPGCKVARLQRVRVTGVQESGSKGESHHFKFADSSHPRVDDNDGHIKNMAVINNPVDPSGSLQTRLVAICTHL